MTRTFVAIELPATVQKRAGDLIARLQAAGARVSWVAPENMHLTLKFLGEQTDNDVARICRRVMDTVGRHQPFSWTCQGAGAFPDLHRPRTLWIGVRDGATPLGQLQQAVDADLAALGHPTENRAYHPHLTIGRVRSGGQEVRALGELIRQADQFLAGTVATEEVVVYGSFLQRGGPRYEVLARAALGH